MFHFSNLSDGYVKDPEKEFPIGKLETGRVLSAEPLSKRVEVTLKMLGASDKNETSNLCSLHVGDAVSGRIKLVESFGLFITMNDTNLDGLCHKSELSDDHIDIETEYRAGERVRAKILKVGAQGNQISLGMKESYVLDGDNAEETSDEEVDDETVESNGFTVGSKLITLFDSHIWMDVECTNMEIPILAQAESRASVPPLEVTGDNENQEDVDMVSQNQEHMDEVSTLDEKSKRKAKKKAKEDWALQIINIQEESEKLNIWVPYFNLENEYGNPPEEAVKKVFQRALQYNDPNKVHLALLGMYESAEQRRLADEVVDKMTKKFKRSSKIQRFLNQQQDRVVQSIVNRTLLSLPEQKHMKFVSQTAVLELKCVVPHIG